MDVNQLITNWFETWERGDFQNLPITDDFKHTSPFGTINGKEEYLNIVTENKDKFLGYQFEIHDTLCGDDRACVRYTAVQGDFRLDVSEWYSIRGNLIESVIAYYHIGEIREDRKLADDKG